MPRSRRALLHVTVVACVSLVLSDAALADESFSGGMSAPERPQITDVRCATTAASSCRRGELLEVRGEHLSAVKTVVFLGRGGARDDRRARPIEISHGQLTVAVPIGARSGRIRAVASAVERSAPSHATVRVLAAARNPSPARPTTVVEGPLVDGIFPIAGPHDLGQSAANTFGGGRGHQGQDMFAACGTPLVAVRGGTVTKSGSESRAGHYLVIGDSSGQSYVYMHMAGPPVVHTGDPVTVGQAVGQVGDTGRASGCHLHFELWTAPGWYTGGQAVDPLPLLRQWEVGI